MQEKGLSELLEGFGVIPVIAVESPEWAIPLADALIEGDLPVVEITFRTQAAAEVIKSLTRERPELLVGAGTVLSTENLIQAREYGATFAVAPGYNPHIVEKSLELAFPFFPGIMTPTDIEKGLSVGVRTFKYFPAEASGGISMLKAMSAPYVHLGLRFFPTGGVNINNIEDYLGINQVLAVGGTWIATKEMIASKQWESIKDNAMAARKAVTKIRGR